MGAGYMTDTARLDGDLVTLELVVKRADKQVTEKLGPYPRYLCDLMLEDAKKRAWFVSGKVVA